MKSTFLRCLLPAFALVALSGCDRTAARFIRQIDWIGQGRWVKADTHIHTTFSDGASSVDEVAYQAKRFGCQAIAITDHADSGLQAASAEYAEAIEAARRQHPNLIILAGLEWNVPPWEGDEHATVLVPPGPGEFLTLAEFKRRFDGYERKEPPGSAAEALDWLARSGDNSDAKPVVIYNHPRRTLGSSGRLADQLQKWADSSDLVIGFSGAPGHQRGTRIGAYDSPIELIDRWDRAAAEVDGTWDRLLRRGFDVWAARAASDFHNATGHGVADYWPGQFSETWLYVPVQTAEGVLKAFRAGSFFAAHGHIVREVELTVHAEGLARPAHAGEVIDVQAGEPISIRLTCRIPDDDFSGRPNRIDSVEFIAATADRAGVIAELQPQPGRAELTHDFFVPPGGMVVRARGRRIVEDGPDLMFYTNPIRIVARQEASTGASSLLSGISARQVVGAVLLLLAAAAMTVRFARGKRAQPRMDIRGYSSAANPDESAKAPGRWHYFLAAVFFTAIAIYGSLVPLRYHPLSLDEAVARFLNLRYLTISVENRADWVANILLFVPLSFSWCGAAMVDRRFRGGRLVWGALIVVACSLLAFAIEFTQLWFPRRTVSQNDIIAETIGGVVGTALWLYVGQELTRWIRKYIQQSHPRSQVVWLLQAYLLGLVIYSVLPLDLTIHPAELYRKWQQGKIELVPRWQEGFSGLQVWALLTDMLIFVPVGALASLIWPGRDRPTRSMLQSVVMGSAVVVAVEGAQLIVYSRFTSATDVVLGIVGIWVGAWVARRWQSGAVRDDGTADRRLLGSLAWTAAAVAYAAILCAVFWWPYSLQQDSATIRARVDGFIHVPFARLYTGSEYNAATEIVRKLLLFMPLGFILSINVLRFRLPRRLRQAALTLAVLVIVGFGTFLELGQAMFPPHIPDVTDVLLYTAGAGIGLLVALRLDRARFELIRRRGSPASVIERS